MDWTKTGWTKMNWTKSRSTVLSERVNVSNAMHICLQNLGFIIITKNAKLRLACIDNNKINPVGITG